MSTLREHGVLIVGFGGAFDFTLRPATLADTYAAAGAVPVPDALGDDNPASAKSANIAYQMAVEDANVLSQIERLGELATVPDIPTLVAGLDPDDMAVLRQAAALLKKRLRPSKPGLPPTGEPNTSSSAPAGG